MKVKLIKLSSLILIICFIILLICCKTKTNDLKKNNYEEKFEKAVNFPNNKFDSIYIVSLPDSIIDPIYFIDSINLVNGNVLLFDLHHNLIKSFYISKIETDDEPEFLKLLNFRLIDSIFNDYTCIPYFTTGIIFAKQNKLTAYILLDYSCNCFYFYPNIQLYDIGKNMNKMKYFNVVLKKYQLKNQWNNY